MQSRWGSVFRAVLIAILAVWASAEPAATTSAPALPVTMSGAQDLLQSGEYDEAVRVFERLADDESTRVQAAVGIARAWRQTGRYEDALARLDAVAAAGRESDDWHVAHAAVLTETGRYADAIATVRRAIELNAKNTTARRMLGELYEITGERDQAIETYAWFDALLQRVYPVGAPALTDAGIGLYRHAVLTRREDATSRTRYVLHELLQPAYERIDPKYWPARLASADLLLSKYNLSQAGEDYRAALKINARLADAHVGLGLIALGEWEFQKVDKAIAAALAINPHSAAAHRLRARLRMTEGKYSDAADAANKALETNPNDVEALALLAAAFIRTSQQQQAQAALDRAAAVNPRSAVVPHELGSHLSAARQFQEAERHFKRAIELAPEWADPQTALGMLYMEIGDERSARRVLDAAFQLDPYHAETKNTLDLLDTLERFGRDETEHFIIKSAEGPDAAIRPYLAACAERIYEDVCRRFGGAPAAKTIVEVFPDHHWFAVRITGRPFIHTIGACTGRVIAMEAPRVSPTTHPFNWARVLRHEFVHTVTLAATGNRIPHWLTEGLAVRGEGGRRSWDWCQALSMAVRRDRLFDLETIDWAFVRPKRPGDWTLAYAQSEWMVEYLVERHAADIIDRMLEGFDEGNRQAEVFTTVVGQPPEAFIADFTRWAARQIEAWRLPTAALLPVSEIEKKLADAEAEAKPALFAALAEAHLDDHKLDEAEEAIRKAVASDEPGPQAMAIMMQVLAVRAAQAKDENRARALRQEAADWARRVDKLGAITFDAPWVQATAARALAVAAMDAKDSAQTITQLKRIRQIHPNDPFPYPHLADLYLEQDDAAKALVELTKLARLQQQDAGLPTRIAELHLTAGRNAEAIPWFQQAVQMNPYSTEIHDKLGQLLMRESRFDEAVAEFAVLTRLEPANAGYHSRLAFALHRAGRKEEARAAAKRAVALEPECEAKSLLGSDQ